MMKKIFGLIALAFLIGCDDGDMTFKTFNFGNANVQTCSNSNILYKVSGTEALLLELDPAVFINVPTNGNLRMVTLGGSSRLIYRNYSGTVSSSSFCADIPPASPTVIEEWTAQPGGTISIETVEKRNTDQELIGYDHNIRLVSITYTREGETIIINDNLFGTLQKPLNYSFDFLDEENVIQVSKCDENNKLFRISADKALVLNLNPTVFPSAAGTTEIALSVATDTNEVLLNDYTGTATSGVLCSQNPPITPVIERQWEANAGKLVIKTSIITGGGLRHEMLLKDVIFKNRDNLGETFIVGNSTDGYLIGHRITP
jgi:hypothetical protein